MVYDARHEVDSIKRSKISIRAEYQVFFVSYLPADMHIRPVTRNDLPEIGDLIFHTFQNDGLFKYLYPHQNQYPDDLRRQHLLRLRNRFVEVGSHGFVTVTDQSDADWKGTTEITGIAFCVRTGDDEVARRWRKDSLFNST